MTTPATPLTITLPADFQGVVLVTGREAIVMGDAHTAPLSLLPVEAKVAAARLRGVADRIITEAQR